MSDLFFYSPSDPKHVRLGFHQVFSDITLPETVHEVLFEDYLTATHGSQREDEKVFIRHLANVHWDWPWLDLWRDRFTSTDLWPYMWKAPVGSRDRRLVILAHTVFVAIHCVECLAEGEQRQIMFAGKGWQWRLLDGDPDVDARFLPERKEQITAGDLRLRPPAYPGDRAEIGFYPPR